MKNMGWFGIAAALVVACTQPRKAAEVARMPATAQDIPHALAQQNVDAAIYQNTSAEAHRLYQQCYELARLRLEENLRRAHALPPAVVVDIDETVLDNSPYQMTNIREGRTYSPATWSEWTTKASAKASPGAVDFLRWANAQGCDVFYISNRSEAEKAVTIKNLRDLGFPTVDDEHVLCMIGRDSDKTIRRAVVREKRYIALLVGDQLRDFDEAFKMRVPEHGKSIVDAWSDTLGQYFILLPNPMYGTWLDDVGGKSDSLKLERKAEHFRTNSY